MVTTETQVLPSPFPGLRPFKTEETHLFFGREGQVDEVLGKLSDNKFAAILGTSGSGKSSLMYCGLIPSLYGGFMTQEGSNWRVIVARPGVAPIANLAEELLKSDLDGQEEVDEISFKIKKESNLAVLRSSSLGLIELTKKIRKDNDENVLIVIDQFEELFRFARMEAGLDSVNESAAFVKLLLNAIHQSEVPIYIVMTMRSDYIGDCANFPQLTNMINDSHYLIPQMTRDQKRSAILGPVAVGGGKMAPRLVQQLLNDLGDKHDQLPILQHALMRTWDYWARNRDGDLPMDIFHYESIGGMEEALSLHADEAYDELSKPHKEICAHIFKSLTEKGNDGRGIRRPTRLGDIAEISGTNYQDVIFVIEVFRMTGRTFLMPPPTVVLDEDAIVDISHESLMRVWVRCKEWVEEEGESAKMYARLCEAAEMQQIGKAGLWRPPDLQLALNWKQKQHPNLVWAQRYDPAFERTMVFLEASRVAYDDEQKSIARLQKRKVQIAKYVAIVVGLVALIAIFAGIYGTLKADEATSAKKDAELNLIEAKKAQKDAEKQKKLALAQKKEAEDARKLALVEKEKAKLSADLAVAETEKANKALADAEIQRKKAELSANDAKIAKEAADLQKEKALKSEKLAKKAQDEAILSKKEAERLNFLSISNAMAVKSLRVKDTVLQALLARQAYTFNKTHNSGQSNPDVYEGLYFAEKTLNGKDYNSLVGHTDAIRAMAFDKAGKHLYSVASDGNIYKWNFKKSKREGEIYYDGGSTVFRSLEVSSNNKWLAVGTNKNGIQLFNIAAKDQEGKILENGHIGAVWSMQFTPDNKTLISTGADGKILSWNLATLKPKVIATDLDPRVKSLSMTKDGRHLAGALGNGKLVLWDFSNNNKMKDIYHEKGEVATAIAFSHVNPNLVVKGFESGKVFIWDLSKNDKAHELEGHDARISDIVFSEDGNFMATASFDRSVRIWNMENPRQEPIVLHDHEDWVQSIIFTPDDKYLITGSRDGVVRVFPLDVNAIADRICENPKVTRNLTEAEWNKYIGTTIPYQKTCSE